MIIDNAKNYVYEQFEKSIGYNKRNNEILKKYLLYMENPQKLQEILCEINQNIFKMQNCVRNCYDFLPEVEYNLIPIEGSLEIFYNNGIYHFILDSLLPHRVTTDATTGKITHFYNKDVVYSRYRQAVEEYGKKHTINPFSQKVIAAFVQYYEKGKKMTDHDNLDAKPFIDAAIKNILIPDDSPKWLSQLWDYKEGSYTHTEVYVGNPQDVLNFLNII